MKTSEWLYLATACLAVLGLFVFWPALIVGVFVSLGAHAQRKQERRAVELARYVRR